MATIRRVPVEQVLRELKEIGIVQVMHQSSGSLTNEVNMELSQTMKIIVSHGSRRKLKIRIMLRTTLTSQPTL
ncbi:hypothetical protein [Glutamicibacter soli]|uniref:hypothetical protein n=1 Tax=Glutamicibacter soli TaxID=453836 RepID=UPI003FCF1F03